MFGLFEDVGVNTLHLAFTLSPFWFNHTGGLLYFSIILYLLKNQQEGPSIDWSRFLRQVVLGLPLGWTHAQQVYCKVSVVYGQYLLGGLIHAWGCSTGMVEFQGSY